MDESREARIRQRAVKLWEQAGRHGVHDDYMDEAIRQIDAEYEHPDQPSPADKREPLIP